MRFVHGFISFFFLLCIIQIYYSYITDTRSLWLYVATIAVYLEGFIEFTFNKGDCPLIHIQKRIGDNIPFFELFFPPNIAKMVIPVVGVVTVFGSILVLLQSLGLL